MHASDAIASKTHCQMHRAALVVMKAIIAKFCKNFQSRMIDVEAYMAFSLKSFDANFPFNLLQKMGFTKKELKKKR